MANKSKRSKYKHEDTLPRELVALLREHSLTLVLVVLLITQLGAYWFQGLSDWKSEQMAHNQPIVIWPDYVTHYMSEVWVSILADTYGALIIVFLTKYFHERHSAESKQSR